MAASSIQRPVVPHAAVERLSLLKKQEWQASRASNAAAVLFVVQRLVGLVVQLYHVSGLQIRRINWPLAVWCVSWLCCGTVLRSTGGAQRRVGKQAHSGLWSLLASLLGGDVDRADRPIAVTLGVLLYFNLVYCSLQLARVHWHPAALLLLAATLHCAAGLLPLVLRRDPERLWSTTAAALHVALLAYASASLQFQRFLTSDAVECRALLQALLQSDPEAATRLRQSWGSPITRAMVAAVEQPRRVQIVLICAEAAVVVALAIAVLVHVPRWEAWAALLPFQTLSALQAVSLARAHRLSLGAIALSKP